MCVAKSFEQRATEGPIFSYTETEKIKGAPAHAVACLYLSFTLEFHRCYALVQDLM